MKKILIALIFVLAASTIPSSGLNSQIQNLVSSSILSTSETHHDSDRYSMRLDFMTESQVDDFIKLRKVTLDDLCDKTMGCKSRSHVVLAVGDKIQLFNDHRISSVELIRLDGNKKTSLARSITNKKESYIVVPQEINRENIGNYMLLIL